MSAQILWAMSRKANKAQVMTGFSCFEHLQGAFRCGILLSDGTQADAIGRSKSLPAFEEAAKRGGTEIVR